MVDYSLLAQQIFMYGALGQQKPLQTPDDSPFGDPNPHAALILPTCGIFRVPAVTRTTASTATISDAALQDSAIDSVIAAVS